MSQLSTVVHQFVQKSLIRTIKYSLCLPRSLPALHIRCIVSRDRSSRSVFIFCEVCVIRKMREIVLESISVDAAKEACIIRLSVNNVLAFLDFYKDECNERYIPGSD